MKSSFARVRKTAGTSLVEILVVIVVFLIGILAIVQIFPGGFKALRFTQNDSIATSLGRAEMDMLKSHADQLPEQIVPVSYASNGSVITISTQADRFPNDLGPGYPALDPSGNLLDASANVVGYWPYLTGGNVGRRVLGEGKIIPAPRHVGSLYYGSLLELQFAPVVFNPAYSSIFVVYGNDLNKHEGDPTGSRVRPTDFYVNNEDSSAQLFLPQNGSRLIKYQVALTAYVGGRRQDIVGAVVTTTGIGGWEPIQLNADAASFPTLNGTLQGIEYDSVRVQRVFEDLTALAPSDWGLGAGITNPDPYFFKLISPQRGLVLFNPTSYNYMIPTRGGRRSPLIGKCSYDVFDWRIIHDEFQAPSQAPYQYRLAINSVKVQGLQGADGNANGGIGVQAPDMAGNMNNADLILEDTKTGGLFAFMENTGDTSKTSYTVNKSTGMVTLLDQDPATPGTQMTVFYPGSNVGQLITVDGRSLRALYMGKGEWSVQVLKPAAVSTETWTRPGASEFYIGGSTANDGCETDRVYFAPAQAGRVVSLGEVYYVNSNNVQVGPIQLTARLETTAMDVGGTASGCPYIKVSDYFTDFVGFDYSYGSAVKSVKGASVAVRVLWNPDTFKLGPDTTTNMNNLQVWMQGWRRSTVETYLQRGN